MTGGPGALLGIARAPRRRRGVAALAILLNEGALKRGQATRSLSHESLSGLVGLAILAEKENARDQPGRKFYA
jgi:hypothetical protein